MHYMGRPQTPQIHEVSQSQIRYISINFSFHQLPSFGPRHYNLKQPITHCGFRKLITVKHLFIGNKISDKPRFSDIIWVTKFVIKSRLHHCNYPLLTSLPNLLPVLSGCFNRNHFQWLSSQLKQDPVRCCIFAHAERMLTKHEI